MVNRGKVFLEAMILNSDFKTCMDDVVETQVPFIIFTATFFNSTENSN